MNLSFAALSDAGPKGENQDVALLPVRHGDQWFAAVSDGIGGSVGGLAAARICIDTLEKEVANWTGMEIAFRRISEELGRIGVNHPELSRMGATLSAIEISNGVARVGHVGDTRIIHLRGGGVMSRTEDQTELRRLIIEGAISPAQAHRYPRRHVLLSWLGPASFYDLFQADFSVQLHDRILLTSDGFHSLFTKRELAAISVRHANFTDFWQQIISETDVKVLRDDATCIAMEIVR